jgi:hypothetical protein
MLKNSKSGRWRAAANRPQSIDPIGGRSAAAATQVREHVRLCFEIAARQQFIETIKFV